MKMHVRAATLCVLASLAVGGCDSTESPLGCQSIVIGAGLPLSGGSEGTGQNVLRAIALAVEDVNAAGGIEGQEVDIHVVDDGSGLDRAVVTSAAEELTSDECLVAVVGHLNSNATLWAQEVYDRDGVVNFTPASTASSIARNSSWTFRNLTHNGYKGRFLADYAKSNLGIDSLGVIFDDDSFGTDLKTFFVLEAGTNGLKIIGESSYSRSRPADFSASVSAIVGDYLAAGAQSIYVSGLLNEGVVIVNEVRTQAGPEMPIIWSGWEEPLLIQEAGANAEGVHVPIHRTYDPDNPEVDAFKGAFQARYGDEPGAFAPFAYDAVRMIADALESVGANRRLVRAHLASIDSESKAYRGLTGSIYFDDDGDLAEHHISALVVRGGEFVPFEE